MASESELPDATPGEELRALEETVDRLLEVLESVRDRAREAEEAHEELRSALERTGGEEADEPVSVEERFRRLTEENERLRTVLDEGREKADRIRSRLVLLEDETT